MAKTRLFSLVALALTASCVTCRADAAAPATKASLDPQQSLAQTLRPQAAFAQIGGAAEVTAVTAGLIWDPGWNFLPAPWNVTLEASLSRWNSRSGYPADHGVLAQVALVPVFRWRADQGRSPWFWQGGIGLTATSSVYRSTGKRFSTSFNFGDHVGVGYSFGRARSKDLVLRFEHFSNAGIKHPNPGQNFVQLRYVHRFD